MPSTIPTLSYSALDYLRSFDLAAVAVSASGRVFVTTNPQNVTAAWWCKREHADQIANAAWMNADIPAAAHRLGLSVTAHAKVIERVQERTARIEAVLQQAKADGQLAQFHREYKARRLQAKARGEKFMPFAEAERRVRAMIADAVARGEIPKSFASVFDGK